MESVFIHVCINFIFTCDHIHHISFISYYRALCDSRTDNYKSPTITIPINSTILSWMYFIKQPLLLSDFNHRKMHHL